MPHPISIERIMDWLSDIQGEPVSHQTAVDYWNGLTFDEKTLLAQTGLPSKE